MRNTAFLLFIVGIFIILNSSNFVDIIMGKTTLTFLNPKDDEPAHDLA